MADILLTRQAVLLAKSEGTYGTYDAPATSDAVLTTIPSFSFDVETYEREMARSSLSPLPPRTTNIDVSISFSCEIKGSGTAGTAPEVKPLLIACGMAETGTASANVFGMKSDPSNIPSASLLFYWGGHMYKVAGCVGNFSCSFEAGGIGLFNFELKGKYLGNAEYDTSEPMATPTYDSELPPLLNTATLTVDSNTALDISKMEFNLNNEVTSLKNIGDAQPSSTRFFVSGRKPSGSFDPLVDKGTSITPSWFALLENATAQTIKLEIDGGAAGNKVDFYFGGTHNAATAVVTPVAQNVVTGLSFDDDSGVRRFGISFNMSGNFATGDDELWIKYY